MTEEQRTNLEAMAEEAFNHWQQTTDWQQSAALIASYAQCMNVLTQDRIATALEFFRQDYEKEQPQKGPGA